jgi:D-glucosaminate-6-phosphate ammonia-lyase
MNLFFTKRRTLLRAVSSLPGLGILAQASGPSAHAQESVPGRDVLRELGVRTFINAGGTFTALTGSLMRPEVVAAIQVASKKFVRLEDLHEAVGARIASLIGCEAALVTSGCASALMLATAACLTGDDPRKMRALPDTTGLKTEVIVQKTHRVNYDHAIRNTGVKLVEVETRDELTNAIGERTAMMFFLNSSDPRGKVHHEEFVAIAKSRGVPTLIDAAADVPPVENLWKYTRMGFDLVGFSGGKGLRGPQSSGLLLGRKDLIKAARLNTSPNGDTIGRTNKVNKEEIVGMLVALEIFLKEDHAAAWKEWEDRCQRISRAVSGPADIRTEVYIPQIANAVPHLRVSWDAKARGVTVAQIVSKLREGTPSIEFGPGAGSGRSLNIGVWMLEPGEDAIVANRLRSALGLV